MRPIDADELQKKLDDALDEYDGYDPNDLMRFAVRVDNEIINAPTVAERQKGKWIKEDKPWGGFGDRVLVNTCSECGESFVYHGNNPKFCPECGAEMEADND